MPNHVTNKLLFHPCTEKRFNEILADLQKEGAEHGSIDLGRIIPEPEGLFMGDLGVEEMKKYKDNNWYDWRIKHWNTKWNAYGFEPPAFSGDTGTMTFRTANCSPFPVIFKLSQKYPDVEIDLRYADEDIGYNVGEITVCAGELIDDNSPQYGSATAQELAADILGLNLDFDLNTGSGYVVSLLGNYYEYCEDVRISQAFQCDVSLGCPVVLCYDEDHGKVWLERSPIFGENMEIKCKVSFTLPEDLIEALGIDEDTPIIASVSGNRILLEIADEDIDEDDPDCIDDLYDSFDDDCGQDCSCDECEYFCPNCGNCVLV